MGNTGSISALAEQKLAGEVLVTGQDGELAALQRIVEGDQTMTVFKPDVPLAKVLAETIMTILKGQEPKATKTSATTRRS